MIIILKIILGLLSLSCLFFGRLVIREYKLFNADIETKSTSLAERILVNGIIFIILSVLLFILSFSIVTILSKIQIESLI